MFDRMLVKTLETDSKPVPDPEFYTSLGFACLWLTGKNEGGADVLDLTDIGLVFKGMDRQLMIAYEEFILGMLRLFVCKSDFQYNAHIDILLLSRLHVHQYFMAMTQSLKHINSYRSTSMAYRDNSNFGLFEFFL